MGRPSKYDTEIKPYLKEIQEAVEAGATIEEIADAFGIAESTIYKYKKEKKEFSKAFMRGRKRIVFEIKGALLKKALGFTYKETKTVAKKDKDGKNIVMIEEYERQCLPSETAAAMLLRNYDETWQDNDNNTVKLKQQEADLRKAIAEANNFDLDI